MNYDQAKNQTKKTRVELVSPRENLFEKIAKQTSELGIKNLRIDSINVDSWENLTREYKGTNLKIDCTSIKQLRIIKDNKEIELLRKAGELTSAGMKAARESLRAGVKECEVAAEIEYTMRKKGSTGTAFETSVASGIHSAFPHGGCTDREIRSGDIVIIDMGAMYNYYCSDMTRTLVAGKPTEKQCRLANLVEEAMQKACKALKSGIPARDVDDIARQKIESSGYGDLFVHGLGHGVGLEIHEPPTLNCASSEILSKGNVVTIEPGVYQIGYGGFRMEDTVAIKRSNAEKLTEGPYTLNE